MRAFSKILLSFMRVPRGSDRRVATRIFLKLMQRTRQYLYFMLIYIERAQLLSFAARNFA
jgi:hypothetical protein